MIDISARGASKHYEGTSLKPEILHGLMNFGGRGGIRPKGWSWNVWGWSVWGGFGPARDVKQKQKDTLKKFPTLFSDCLEKLRSQLV